MDYFFEIMKAVAAPAFAVAALGTLGKWYLDRALLDQTKRLETALDQETERLKITLAARVTMEQARLQSIQQLSKAVHRSRRAFRSLVGSIFPQSDARLVLAKNSALADPQAFAKKVADCNGVVADSFADLEEQLTLFAEYVPEDCRDAILGLIRRQSESHDMVLDLLTTVPKRESFADDLATIMGIAEDVGSVAADVLTTTKNEMIKALAK